MGLGAPDQSVKPGRAPGRRVEPLLYLSLMVVALALTLVIVVRAYHDKVSKLKEQLREMDSSKRSLSTTYGRITEQWAPFMEGYPHDPQRFRFLGSPVDGVQFADDRVVFVEFKTNTSRLTPEQQRIRQLVEEKRVEWLEFRLGEKVAPPPAQPPEPSYWGASK